MRLFLCLFIGISAQRIFAEERISLNGDHFFIATPDLDSRDWDHSPSTVKADDYFHIKYHEEKVGLTSVLLDSHRNTPSLCNFYINHKRNLKYCFQSHSERRTRHSGGSTYHYTITVCDAYETLLSDYQTNLQLQVKGQGAKKPRNFQLSFKQEEEGGKLSYHFTDLNSSVQGKQVKNLTTINYKHGSKPLRSFKNSLGMWNFDKLLSVDYKEDLELLFENQKNGQVIKQSKVEPIVKSLSLVFQGGETWEPNQSKFIDVEYYVPKKYCLQKVDAIHNGKAYRGCISFGYLPRKEVMKVEIVSPKGFKNSADRVIKLNAIQKYLGDEPKLTLATQIAYKGVNLYKNQEKYILSL